MTNLIISGFGQQGIGSGAGLSGSVTVLSSGPTGATFEQPIGSDRSYQLSLYATDGQPVNGLQPTDLLTASLWSGENQSILYRPPVSWLSPSSATIQLSISASGLAQAGVVPGTYRIQVNLVAGAQNLVVLDGSIRLTASPGVALPPPVYCSFEDMKTYAPWLDSLLDSRDEQTGFAMERARARQWLDDLITRAYRGGVASVFGNDPGGNWGGLWGSRRTLIYSPYILAQLQQNSLIIRPAVVEAVAKYSIGLVCQAQLGRAGLSDYARLADRFLADSHNSALCLTAEIDTNGDGIGDIAITLGTTNAFWA